MKLSSLFGGAIQTEHKSMNTENVHGDNVHGDYAGKVSRQIRSLVPGQTLLGEVVGKNGGEVLIKVSEDVVLSARLEREIAIEVGKAMTFEVKNNGTALFLSPLFSNTAADANVLKALEMANLPVHERSVEMTEQMMQQGMSIDKNALQVMYRDVAGNPETSPVNIVLLRRLGMEVNTENMEMLENYQALKHQLVSGMTDILEEIPLQFQTLIQDGKPGEAARLCIGLTQVLTESGLFSSEGMAGAGETLGQTAKLLPQGQEQQAAEQLPELPEGAAGQTMGAAQNVQTAGNQPADGQTVQILSENSAVQQSDTADTKNVPEQILSQAEQDTLMTYLRELGESGEGTAPEDILKWVGELKGFDEGKEPGQALLKLLGSREYGKLLKNEVMRQWLLEPETVQEKQKVSEVYQRISRQLSDMRQVLSSVSGGSDSSAAKAVTAMQHNIDFINQINQMYTYIQLPLSMNGRATHGELYVYTNKKHLAQKDGNVSALLHLDMEHLGAVDVYVAMQNQNVNTKFYLQSDDMIDFIQAHIHILNERLEKRGYAMHCEMVTKEPSEQEKSVIDRITETEGNVTMLSQYAFDVRA